MSVPDPGTQSPVEREDATAGDGDGAVALRWGIDRVPWLWGARLRILFVTDGRINTGHSENEFGLGPVLDTLRDRSFAWWVHFDVDVVRRNPPTRFRFTQNGFDINDFDQVWFFGDWPGLAANDPAEAVDEMISLDQYEPLEDAELRLLAEWMERGGGVFAAGDHSLLGASMCHRIPRVRTMRRWTRAQGVPSFEDEDRNETLVSAPVLEGQEGDPKLRWEGDRWAQRISPVYQRDTTRPFSVYGQFPHPLLCGRAGAIDHFPDHMHEGVVIEDNDVELNRPLDIPGFAGAEYPLIPGGFAPAIVGEPEPFGARPRPHVIAHGWTTNAEAEPRRFGLIGVDDGDLVGLGRVVVESTWHHWFSMNLVGFISEAPSLYRGMQNYYRNVALWLARPEQRVAMLFAATWGVLVGKHPGAFGKVMGIWEVGARVVDVIGRSAPQCILSELVATFLERQPPGEADDDHPRRQPAPALALNTMVTQAIVGGIGIQLMDMAHHHIVERARGRDSALDKPAIWREGLAGVANGQRELAATIGERAAELEGLRDALLKQLEGQHTR